MAHGHKLHALIHLGETGQVERVLGEMDAVERNGTPARTAEAALLLARAEPQAALDLLASRDDDPRAGDHPMWIVAARILDAIARDSLGRPDEAADALERALDAAAPDTLLLPFLVHPVPDLLERHTRSAHAGLLGEILGLLRADDGETRASTRPIEPLSGSEMRVLRYLPTNLSAPEIAAELSLSVNTVRTHMRHVYEKLGAHSRFEAVELARSLNLVAPQRT
jgi:LuxR family maltose regulon positive regulatory protein